MTGMPEFRKSMEVHVKDVQKEKLRGDHFAHIENPQIGNNPRGLRFLIRNLMYVGGRKSSMA